MQGELFQDKVSLPSNFTALAQWDPTAAYQIARHRGYLHGQAIWEVVKANLNFNYKDLFYQLGLQGYWHHLKIKIDEQIIEVIGKDGVTYFNGSEIDSYTDSEVHDKQTENRIKSNIKKFILVNQFQFDIDENTF